MPTGRGQWQSRAFRSSSPDKKAYTSGRISWRKTNDQLRYQYTVKGRVWSHIGECVSAQVYKWHKGEASAQGRVAKQVCGKEHHEDYSDQGQDRNPVVVSVAACGPGSVAHCDQNR